MEAGRAQGRGIGAARIGQIALVVDDIERAVAFYRDVVGLELLFRAPPSLAFFRCGEVRLMLSPPEDEGGDREGPGPEAEVARDSSSILYYTVTDPGAAHAALTGGAAEVLSAPHIVHRTPEMELWMGFYRDPEGNRFATMCERGVGEG